MFYSVLFVCGLLNTSQTTVGNVVNISQAVILIALCLLTMFDAKLLHSLNKTAICLTHILADRLPLCYLFKGYIS